jgi:hypothetical protein
MTQDSLWGPIPIAGIINRYYAGDEIEIKFMRDGGNPTVEKAALTKLDSNKKLIPYTLGAGLVPHLIFGGLIFQELTFGYLAAWGDEWRTTAPPRLVYLWEQVNPRTDDSSKSIVVLNRVLTDEFNFGYADIGDVVVKTVNGQPVESLKGLESSLRNPKTIDGDRFTEIEFLDGNGKMILGFDDIEGVNQRVRKNYSISSAAKMFKP